MTVDMLKDRQNQGKSTQVDTLQDGWLNQLSSPGVSIDELPTQVNLKSVDDWLPIDSYGWSIDETPTWILPTVSVKYFKNTTKNRHPVAISGTLSQTTLLRKLVKSSGIYAIAAIVPPLVALVLAPFLTHSLSPSDYGILTILNTVIGLGAGITQLGLASAFFRAYGYDYTTRDDQRDVLATVVTLLCLVLVPTTIGSVVVAPFLAGALFGRPLLGNLIILVAGVVLMQNLTVPGFAWLRAEGRALLYSLLTIGNLLVTLLTTVVLVGVMHLGIAGSLMATGCGYASVVLCTMPVIILHAGIKIRIAMARSLLAFGLPLVLNFVSYWVLQLSDRYLLDLFASLTETAKYAVVYTIGSALSVVVIGPFTLAWPTTMFAIARREDAARVFKLVFRWFGFCLLFAAFGLSIVGTVLLYQLFPVAYHSVDFVIPIVAGSIAFYGIYFIFMAGANIKRKTWLTAVFTTVAAVVNISLNLILIPRYGAAGAAVSTLLAYIALVSVAYIVNQRIYPVPFEIGLFSIALFVGVALYIGSDYLGRVLAMGTTVASGISICALCLYGGCLAWLGKFPVLRLLRTKTGIYGRL